VHHPLTDFVRSTLKPFSDYDDCLKFELGLIPKIKIGDRHFHLPELGFKGDESGVQIGTWWLLETAARIEDRLRWEDFTFKRWPFQSEYDFIWLWASAAGLPSPLFLLVAIDLALNPVLPYGTSSEEPLPLQARLAHTRFASIMNLLFKWLEDESLPAVPSRIDREGWYQRNDLDSFFVGLEKRISAATGWATPVEAFRYLSQNLTEWGEYGIKIELIQAVLARRIKNPSIFAFQTIAKSVDHFLTTFPPLFFLFSDGFQSTITDPVEGTIENIRLLRKSIAEQIICDAGHALYICPFCRREIRTAEDHDRCSAEQLFPAAWKPAQFTIEDFAPFDGG
jgi:hypothetical protein